MSPRRDATPRPFEARPACPRCASSPPASPDRPTSGVGFFTPSSVVALALALALSAGPAPACADGLPPRIQRALDHTHPGWPRRWPRAPQLDLAREATGASRAWARTGTLGRGATVCVVDTGVDLRHQDFRDAEGHTRAAWVAVLGAAPRGTEPDLEARFGAALWNRSALDDALARGLPMPGDPHGHGTAVASAALGDDAPIGASEPGPHAGIAPEATLIVVHALRADSAGFEDPDVVAGTELCFALAGRGPSPTAADRTVALLALGGHDGAHDGTEPLEQALAAVAARGHALVTAAGNDGDGAVHAAGRALPSAPARVEIQVPEPRGAPAERWVSLSVRTDGEVALRAPDGTEARALDGARVEVRHTGGVLVLDRTQAGVTRAVLGGGDGVPALRGGRYGLEVAGAPDATFDAWIVGADVGASLFAPRFVGQGARGSEEVTIPASSPALIAVGATVTRPRLGTVSLVGRDDGTASLSARGPGVEGAPRPDLAAPGGLLVVALSSDVLPDGPHNLVGGEPSALARRRVGDTRIAVAGTSLAAAIVAGAHALAYSIAPAALERDRALLRATAEGPEAWTPTRGAGALRIDAWLDARAAPDAAGPVDAGQSALGATRTLTTPGASDVWFVARVRDARGRPVHGGVLALSGTAGGAVLPIRWGWAEGAVRVTAPAGTSFAVTATSGAVALEGGRVEVQVDDGPAGIAWPRGGGCRVAPRARSAGLVIPMLAVLLGLVVRRARVSSGRGRRRA